MREAITRFVIGGALLMGLALAPTALAVDSIVPLSGDPPLGAFAWGGPGSLGQAAPFIGDAEIRETINQADTPVRLLIDGLNDNGDTPTTFIKLITNDTGIAWESFMFEILVDLTGGGQWTHSPDGDGISFNQNNMPPPPRLASDVFASMAIDELGDRDFVMFTDGIVNHGDTVLFRFQITDFGANEPFVIEQIPNAIPEPATIGLLALGGLTLLRRRG